MKYKISIEAKNDIEKIWLYTFENWSLEQADRYFDLIMDEIEYIAEDPASGKNFSDVRKGYMRTRIKSHFILYKVNKKLNEVEIIRVLHQRMHIENRLNDE
ncbi:MAG: type II toxin-antitoxin system RelE/ParE family toxin [Chitinophagales bacterium]|nr:type II toxin-antitoxin system RelE/ParE family toxin [Chitinophagales bacterium]